MGLKLLPNAAVYHVQLPLADALAEHLAKLPFAELQPSHPQGSGFVAVEPSDDLVYEFKGGYAFALRLDEKIVPGSVVKSELKKWIADFEEREGYKPGRKMIVEGREIVTAALTARALIRTKIIRCLYDTERKYLFVPALGKSVRDLVTKQLVRAVESVKSQTINVSEAKGSLTRRLHDHINDADVDESPFGDFEVGSKVVMVGPESKTTFDLSSELHAAANGINEAITTGGQVTEIALVRNGVSFRLTHDFMLKGVKFLDDAIEYDQSNDPDVDPHYAFEQEAAIQLLLVGSVMDALCQLFDYQPKSDEDDGSDLA